MAKNPAKKDGFTRMLNCGFMWAVGVGVVFAGLAWIASTGVPDEAKSSIFKWMIGFGLVFGFIYGEGQEWERMKSRGEIIELE